VVLDARVELDLSTSIACKRMISIISHSSVPTSLQECGIGSDAAAVVGCDLFSQVQAHHY